jgi:hypothetical protein
MSRRHRKYSSYPSYLTNRTPQEERLKLEGIRDRLQFGLSHQDECYVDSVWTEEMVLEWVLEFLRKLDELTIG